MNSIGKERWISLLPNLVTEDYFNSPVMFLKRKFFNFRTFVTNVTTTISLIMHRKEQKRKKWTFLGTSRKKNRLSLPMKEIKENKTLKLSEIANWTVMTENSKKVNVKRKKRFNKITLRNCWVEETSNSWDHERWELCPFRWFWGYNITVHSSRSSASRDALKKRMRKKSARPILVWWWEPVIILSGKKISRGLTNIP